MCQELGISAFGLYDGDQQGSDCYEAARKKFAAIPRICVAKLWEEDIRDKPDESPPKRGIFDAKWKIKEENDRRLRDLLSCVTRHIAPGQVA
jgi:hypothetical protein